MIGWRCLKAPVRHEMGQQWGKTGFALELGQTELHRSMEAHLSHPLAGNGTGNGGLQIIIGKKALTLLASIPLGGTVAAVAAYLKSIGVL